MLWLEPRLLVPPVDATAQAIFSLDLPEGTYEEIKLQIHKPTDAGADAQFLQAHPEFAGLSIKVTGTFNGTPFTFTSALTSEVEITLDAPVEVGSAAPTSVTLQIDLNSWFAAESGGVLNPIQPSQDVRSRIEQNIRRSFHAFEDDDHNEQARLIRAAGAGAQVVAAGRRATTTVTLSLPPASSARPRSPRIPPSGRRRKPTSTRT